MTMSATDLPTLGTIELTRKARLLVLTMNRPEAMNAVNLELHDDLATAMAFAQADPDSDVLLVTGAGGAFSAGGDLDHIARNAADPRLFDHEAAVAKRIVYTMLDIDKPIVARMNGHAI